MIEQAEQEPVAWFVQYKNRHEFVFGSKPEFIVDGVVEPLYAAPVRTKDLTVSELNAIVEKYYDDEIDLKAMILDGITADREKNCGS